MENLREEFRRLIRREADGMNVLRAVELLTARYPGIVRRTLGRSLLGMPIEMLDFAPGRPCVLYVGCHHGMESITSSVLLAFAWECASGGSPVSCAILPMLNPDGAELRVHGLRTPLLCGKPARIRALLPICPDGDFSRWQANARGVDLNHNYDAGFSAYRALEIEQSILPGPTKYAGKRPESEPETRSLARWIRRHRRRILGVISLHTQGEEIYFGAPSSRPLAEQFADLCSYRLGTPTGTAAYGGLTDWLSAPHGPHIPALTLECGKGRNPLPPSALDGILDRLLPALHLAPEVFRAFRQASSGGG